VGSGFQVDMGQLAQMLTTLSDAKDSMSSADDALKDASPQDLGSASLDSAGGSFRDKWTYGIGKLADLAQDMTGGLEATKKAYQQCESAIADAFDKSAGGGAGAVGAAAGAAAGSGASQIAQRLGGAQ
jgi:conjugal transfer/entry exclusion protein